MERYVSGDRVQVWTEITSLGVDVRSNEFWPEAVDVARETMRRARENVESLTRLLSENGYEFAVDTHPLIPPQDDVVSQLDRLEQTIGQLPLSLRCWFEEVGQVNLAGRHPAWEYDYSDPLVIEAPIDYVLTEHAGWEADRGTAWDRRGFVIDLAPDYLHKAQVSGGPPYAMAVPNAAADGALLWERHQTTFVNYLRICFRWGGFPGWDRGSLDGWARPPVAPPALLGDLAGSLIDI
jgi:hypothetical protein